MTFNKLYLECAKIAYENNIFSLSENAESVKKYGYRLVDFVNDNRKTLPIHKKIVIEDFKDENLFVHDNLFTFRELVKDLCDDYQIMQFKRALESKTDWVNKRGLVREYEHIVKLAKVIF